MYCTVPPQGRVRRVPSYSFFYPYPIELHLSLPLFSLSLVVCLTRENKSRKKRLCVDTTIVDRARV